MKRHRLLLGFITAIGLQAFSQNKPNTIVERVVLLENYSGVKCGNCPSANAKAEQIAALYPNNVVVLNIHAGFFATPNGTYTADLRTSAGDNWDNYFGISMAGNPNGMINRMDFSSNHIKNYTSWQSLTGSFIPQAADIAIKVENKTYNPVNRQLDFDIKIKFLGNLSSIYKVILVLSEDSIIAEQLDYSTTPNFNPSYNHNHVLRGAINGSWGTLINTGAVTSTDSTVLHINSFSVSPSFNENHLNIVAFAYDTTSHEVVQVQKFKMQNVSTNILNYTKNNELSIYPNPSNGTLNITSSLNSFYYSIYDQLGRSLLAKKSQNKAETVNIDFLDDGVYFVQIKDENGKILKTEKLIKN